MIKKTLSILILSTFSTLLLAAGEHSGEHHTHSTPDHDMSTMSQAAPFYGQPGEQNQVSRTIEVMMDDAMRFTPSQIDVKASETVRFLIINSGKIPHEMVIGSLAELKEHAAEMLKMPNMQHSEPNMITLDAGQRGELIWQFDKATMVDFACLIPGHAEAGMVGKITVK